MAVKFQTRLPERMIVLLREMEKSTKAAFMSSVLHIVKIREIKYICFFYVFSITIIQEQTEETLYQIFLCYSFLLKS